MALSVFSTLVAQAAVLAHIPRQTMKTPQGEQLDIFVATTYEDQKTGLSGIASKDFAAHQGMMFIYGGNEPHRVWMPDTYFDLDIFFLDEKFKVLDIHRKMKAHPGRNTPPEIMISKEVPSFAILEMRADSPIAKKIKKGDQLKVVEDKNGTQSAKKSNQK